MFKKILKYFPYLFLASLCLTPIIWFWGKGGGVLINGVDTNFPLNPLMWFTRRFSVWNNLVNGGVDFSSSVAGLFFHLVQVVPSILGFSLQTVEIFSLVFWFTAIILSSYFFAGVVFPENKIPRFIFVVFYTFNTYLFNTWENIKVANLSLTAGIPLILGILILVNEKRISLAKALFFSSLAAIIVSGSGINPSYSIVLFIILLFYFLSLMLAKPSFLEIKRLFKNFMAVVLVLILVNLFWILPTINFISRDVPISGSIDRLGFTNWIDSLSEHTSPLNVMRFQGAWDWYSFEGITGAPLYIPYALNYFYRLPFVAFSLVIPFLVILSLVFWKKEKRSLYLFLATIYLVGVFLGIGTHLPTGSFYRWLLNHVPFFSLFRSPWYIFTPLVTFASALLIGLLFFRLEEDKQISQKIIPRAIFILLTVVLAGGNLVYSYPLVTGKIFRPGRNDSFYVKFPRYLFTASTWLNEQKTGRIIGYPPDELENFEWGYRGIESVLELSTDKEVVFSPLNSPDSAFAKLVKKFYVDLAKERIASLVNLAQKLNIEMIFAKGDQPSLAGVLTAKVSHWFTQEFGPWKFYRIPEVKNSKLSSGQKVYLGYPSKDLFQMISLLDKDSLLLNPADSQVGKVKNLVDLSGKLVQAENSQVKTLNIFLNAYSNIPDRLKKYDLANVDFDFEIPEEGYYTPILEGYKLEGFGVSPGQGKISLKVDGLDAQWSIVKVDDSYWYFNPQKYAKGWHKAVLTLGNNNLIYGQDFSRPTPLTKIGEGEIEFDSGESFLRMVNKSASHLGAKFFIDNFDPQSFYLISLRYKTVFGNVGKATVSQFISTAPVKEVDEGLPRHAEWNFFNFFYKPVPVPSQLGISLIAPAIADPLGTKIFYDDLDIRRVFTNELIFAKEATHSFPNPKITLNKSTPTEYKGKVEGAEADHLLVFSENYSPQWKLKILGKKNKANIFHFSGNTYANAFYIKDAPEAYDFIIYYFPQKLFTLGGVIGLATFISIFVIYNSIQEHSAIYCGDELNADMSSSFKGEPRSLERGGCHRRNLKKAKNNV